MDTNQTKPEKDYLTEAGDILGTVEKAVHKYGASRVEVLLVDLCRALHFKTVQQQNVIDLLVDGGELWANGMIHHKGKFYDRHTGRFIREENNCKPEDVVLNNEYKLSSFWGEALEDLKGIRAKGEPIILSEQIKSGVMKARVEEEHLAAMKRALKSWGIE